MEGLEFGLNFEMAYATLEVTDCDGCDKVGEIN